MFQSMFIAAYAKARKFITGKDEGATMVEYGIMVALIAAVCIATVVLIGGKISTAFSTVNSNL